MTMNPLNRHMVLGKAHSNILHARLIFTAIRTSPSVSPADHVVAAACIDAIDLISARVSDMLHDKTDPDLRDDSPFQRG